MFSLSLNRMPNTQTHREKHTTHTQTNCGVSIRMAQQFYRQPSSASMTGHVINLMDQIGGFSNAELQQEMEVQMSAFAAMNAAKTGKANF